MSKAPEQTLNGRFRHHRSIDGAGLVGWVAAAIFSAAIWAAILYVVLWVL